jgi:gamma-glutamyltranspeptidase/glutathione hydrolase
MLTHSDTGELYATLSNMGGNMQPQGHMQLTINLLARGMDPQAAIDEPRFCIADGTQDGAVFVEDPVPEEVLAELRAKGHIVRGVSDPSSHVFLRPIFINITPADALTCYATLSLPNAAHLWNCT